MHGPRIDELKDEVLVTEKALVGQKFVLVVRPQDMNFEPKITMLTILKHYLFCHLFL